VWTCGQEDCEERLTGLGGTVRKGDAGRAAVANAFELGNEDGPEKLRRLVRIGPRHRNTSPDGSAGTSGQSPGC
jgi:hypothetical protein